MAQRLKPEAGGVDVHIDRVVVHGDPHVDRRAIGAAIEDHLQRLFEERRAAGLEGPRGSMRLGELSSVREGVFETDAVGEQVAEAVDSALNREGS